MCLILTAFAAVISTAIWYASSKMRTMKISVLCWLFWGAAIMWTVDLVFEYAEEGAAVFEAANLEEIEEMADERMELLFPQEEEAEAPAAENGANAEKAEAPAEKEKLSDPEEIRKESERLAAEIERAKLSADLGVIGVLYDTLLGLSVIVIAMVIWIAVLLVRDPNGVVRAALLKKKSA